MQSTLKANKSVKATDTEVQNNIRLATRIFDEYGDAIREMIRFLVNNESIVDDIFQDLFVSLVHKPIPPGIENIRGYLYRAVKNDVLDEAIRTKNYRIRNQKYAELHTEQVRYRNPEDVVILSEEIQKLFNIVERRLMPHEREAVIQLYRFDRDNNEAAEAMCINRRSFSRYLCTGLKKICRFARENEQDPTDLSCIL